MSGDSSADARGGSCGSYGNITRIADGLSHKSYRATNCGESLSLTTLLGDCEATLSVPGLSCSLGGEVSIRKSFRR